MIKDLIGQKFGRLTVLKFDKKIETSNNRKYYWLCKCECGNIVSINSASLKNGHTLSCGCLRLENCIKATKKHLQTGSDLYYVWSQIKQRCNNPNNKRYNHLITYNNETLTVTQWAEKYNINVYTFRNRISKGWDIKKALTYKK